MDRDDLVLSVQRHATSKLDDDALDDIRTLGFRGEALASIGSVAELAISSRTAEAPAGLQLVVERGHVSGPQPRPMNQGTIVEVRDLFAAVPARRKFLRSARAEAASITDVVRRLAMANPSVHFTLDGEGRSPANWPGSELPGRLAQVMGDEFVENAAPLATSRHGIVVTGLAGLPTYSRANTLSQFYYVNGRSVRDKVLLSAVRAAYADYTFRDRFPVIVLYLAIDPADVDVNVHPAKAELRFRDPGAVRSVVIRAISEALGAAGHRASTSPAASVIAAMRAPETVLAGVASEAAIPMSGFAEPSARFDALETSVDGAAEHPLGAARAQLFENYIVAQSGESLVLVDQHAAHERLVYERFKAHLAEGVVPSQALLIPAIVDLGEDDCDRLEEASAALERLGLRLERFGPRAVAVRETPALLGQTDIVGLIHDLCDELAEQDSASALGDRLEAMIGRMACHGSVRSGRRLRADEMNALLREMEATPHSGQCIHGRPTYVELKKHDLERLFGRTR